MLIGDSALARILRFAATYAPEGEGDGGTPEPLSYDAQIQADVAKAVSEVEAKAPAEGQEAPADTKPDAAADTGPKADARGRLHASDGKFIPKSGQAPSDPKGDAQGQSLDPASQAAAAQQTAQPGAGTQADPAAAVAPSVAAPPPSWVPEAKAQWDALPALIKEAIVKRETEMGAGLAKLRDYRGIDHHVERARRGGQEIGTVLDAYVSAEDKLRSNPAQGLMDVAKMVGMSKQDAAETFLRIAQHLGANVSAYQNGGGQGQSDQNDDPLMEVLQPLIQQALTPLQQQNQMLMQRFQEADTANQTAVAASIAQTLEAMMAEPEFRYLPDLESDIAELFRTGAVRQTGNHRADIARAYRMAAAGDDRIAPLLSNARTAETAQQRQQREADATAKAAKASRSLTGSAIDGAGATPAKGKRREGMSYDQDLRADVERAAGLIN